MHVVLSCCVYDVARNAGHFQFSNKLATHLKQEKLDQFLQTLMNDDDRFVSITLKMKLSIVVLRKENIEI